MRLASLLGAMLLLTLGVSPVRAAEIGAEEAAKHVGESATVCGVVESARYSERSKAQPTFLNLGRPYPNQVFTVLIFGSDRAKFGTPEKTFLHKRICATGVINIYDIYEARPEMIVHDPAQILLAVR